MERIADSAVIARHCRHRNCPLLPDLWTKKNSGLMHNLIESLLALTSHRLLRREIRENLNRPFLEREIFYALNDPQEIARI